MKKISGVLMTLALMFIIACEEPALQESVKPRSPQAPLLNAGQGSMRMDVYYDDEIFTVNMFELPDDAAEKALEHNQNIGEIYTYCDLDEECDWLPIVDSVPGDGYNPLWQEVEIEFAEGVAPYQFTSDTEIEEAADNGEITLTDSGEVYRCAVLNQNH